MVFKSVTVVMDSMVSCNFIGSHSVTRDTSEFEFVQVFRESE